jgi:RNA polymerase sigma-70 factor, ECF subfamily
MSEAGRSRPARAAGVRPFGGLIRIASMICVAALPLEGSLAVDRDVARLRRGDLDALAELVARYQNRLYRYLLRMLRQPAEAEDLFQQTWLRVAEKIGAFDPNRNFDAWLFTLARNLAIDHLRRIQPQSLDEPVAAERSPESRIEQLISTSSLPFDRALASERRSRIAEAMERLPVIYREVLALRFEEEMKIEEIAQVIGAPVSTVKTRLRRSLEQLRTGLETRYPRVDWQ